MENRKEYHQKSVELIDEQWREYRDRLCESLALKQTIGESVTRDLLDAARKAAEWESARGRAVGAIQELNFTGCVEA